ncbi:hypothetical protein HDZ31DRAFT_81737 [Schizophyllum fasciatum]
MGHPSLSVRTMVLRFAIPLLLLASYVAAQTQTVVIGGESIVEAITTDEDGLPTTETLRTLTTTTAATTTATTTDPDDEETTTTQADDEDEETTTQPVVGQPAATTGGANAGDPTPFTYTTLIGGEYQEVEDVFTPSLMETVMPEPTFTGSVMEYSEYKARYTQSTNGAPAVGTAHVGPWFATVAGGLAAGAALVAMV